MSFLAPLFFVALAALAIPVVIHLIQRERKHVVAFPSLMFVRRIPYQSVRRRRIRHWPLLLLRLAALALIVAAFARPFLRRTDAAAAGAAGAREVVVLLDQSYSMAYADRWDRARAAARTAMNTLAPSDRGTLVLFSTRPDVVLRSTADRERLLGAVATATTTAGSTRYAPALQVAGGILATSTLPRREVILISDFQRVGWRGAEGGRLPQGATLTPIRIGDDGEARNLAVTAVSLARSTFANQERVAVTAGLRNYSARDMSEVTVALDLDGLEVQTTRANVEANGSASVTFPPVIVAPRGMRATVRLPADALSRDNVFHFVVSPAAAVPVLVVDRDGARDDTSLYLMRALAIGEAPRFEVVRRSAGAISDDDLRRASVVFLNDVPVAAALAGRLDAFARRGGGLFVALGPRAMWPEGSSQLLPAMPAAPVDLSRGEVARVGSLEYGHPIFELFRAPRSGDFAAAQFFGYRSVAVSGRDRTSPASGVLARFDTGAPALLERVTGSGRVLVWTSTLDLGWSDLPLKPVFLPFIHRAVRHLSAYAAPPPWLTVGQVFDPSATRATASASEARVVLTPSGRRVSLDDEGGGVLELDEQGFYEIRTQATDAAADVIASNVDLAESDLLPVDAAEVAAAATGGAAGAAAAAAALPETPEAQERAQRIWWYLLLGGLVLLGVESLLAARLSRANT
jgi:Mg-chelatase subunit ChlD